MTNFELFKAFLDQTGVAHSTFQTMGSHGFAFTGEDRGQRVDGWGELEVGFHRDGSLIDFFFHETDPGRVAVRPDERFDRLRTAVVRFMAEDHLDWRDIHEGDMAELCGVVRWSDSTPWMWKWVESAAELVAEPDDKGNL